MKKFPLLLLDTGPIIKLFELNLWNKLLQACDVTVSRTVIPELKWASQELEDVRIDIELYEGKGLRIIDHGTAAVASFYAKLSPLYKNLIEPDDGEVATLEYLLSSSEKWILCTADGPVFRLMGSLGCGEQGISLQELTDKVGLQIVINWAKVSPRNADWWKFTKKFREVYTQKGRIDAAQGQGLL
jgi:hypothetical protein